MRVGKTVYTVDGSVAVQGLDEYGLPVVQLKYNASPKELREGFNIREVESMLKGLLRCCCRCCVD
jgi:hypothetical protein